MIILLVGEFLDLVDVEVFVVGFGWKLGMCDEVVLYVVV